MIASAFLITRCVVLIVCGCAGSVPKRNFNTLATVGNATATVSSPYQHVLSSFDESSRVCAVATTRATRHKSKHANSTSKFKGVTKHRGTGKFEAHLWDSSHIRVIKVGLLLQGMSMYSQVPASCIELCRPLRFALICDLGHKRAPDLLRVAVTAEERRTYTWQADIFRWFQYRARCCKGL